MTPQMESLCLQQRQKKAMSNTVIIIMGETTPEVYSAASKEGAVIHLTKEVESQFENFAVIDSSANYIQQAVKLAKDKKFKHAYLINGYSILHTGCLQGHFTKDKPYDIIYSDYLYSFKNSKVREYLTSLDPVNIPKHNPIINNVLIDVDKIKDQSYFNPYHLILENGLVNTCGHIPHALYEIDFNHKAKILIPEIRMNYAKLYLQW